MINYMFFLITIITTLSFYELTKKKYKQLSNIILIIFIVMFSLLFAHREYILEPRLIGTDYYEYKLWFNSINSQNFLNSWTNLGFNFLIIACKLISNSFIFFEFIIGIIVFSSLIIFSRRECKSILLFFYSFITIGILISVFNVTRQWLAISIFLLFFNNIKKSKFLIYLFGILLSSMFHSTAIFLILLYPLIKWKINIKYKICILTIIGALSILFNNALLPFLLRLSDFFNLGFKVKYDNVNLLTSNYTLTTLIFIEILIDLFFINEYKKNVENYTTSSLLLIICFIFSILSTKYFAFDRFNIYFIPFTLTNLQSTISIFHKKTYVYINLLIYIIFFIFYIF